MALSYAQNLEDYHLSLAFAGQKEGFYVDIGGGHPVADNVSFWFYERGWCGVVVEPQAELAEHLTVPVRLKGIRVERSRQFGDVYLALALRIIGERTRRVRSDDIDFHDSFSLSSSRRWWARLPGRVSVGDERGGAKMQRSAADDAVGRHARYLSSRESRRSASTLPPVCSIGQ